MHLQTKGCLLIILLLGHEAHRARYQMNFQGQITRLASVHDEFSKERQHDVSEPEAPSGSTACNVDVLVQAEGPRLFQGDKVRALRDSEMQAFKKGQIGTITEIGPAETEEREWRVQVAWPLVGQGDPKIATFPMDSWWLDIELAWGEDLEDRPGQMNMGMHLLGGDFFRYELGGGDKQTALVEKHALASSVEVGTKWLVDHKCDVVYTLMCNNGATILREEIESCDDQKYVGCTKCDTSNTTNRIKLRDSKLDGIITKLVAPLVTPLDIAPFTVKPSKYDLDLFRFNEDFNEKHACGAMHDPFSVQFTLRPQTCEAARHEIVGLQQDFKEALLSLEAVEARGQLQAHTDKFKPYHKAKEAYNEMGCDCSGADASPPEFQEQMIAKLQELFISHRQKFLTDKQSNQKFTATVAFIKHIAGDKEFTLQSAVKAASMFFGLDDEEIEALKDERTLGDDIFVESNESKDLEEDEDLTPAKEQFMESVLSEETFSPSTAAALIEKVLIQKTNSLLQRKEGQLTSRRRNPINDFLQFALVAGLFIGLIIVLAHVAFPLIIGAILVAVGFISYLHFAKYYGCDREYPSRGCDGYRGPRGY